jgi:hypothetical protein
MSGLPPIAGWVPEAAVFAELSGVFLLQRNLRVATPGTLAEL